MKKKLVVLLSLVLVIVIGGAFLVFGGKKATVNLLNQDTQKYEELTLKEFNKIKDSNSHKFEKCYHGSEGTVISKVKKIDGTTYHNDFTPYHESYTIELEDWWEATVKADHEILNSLEVGDTVKITGKVFGQFLGGYVTDGYLDDIDEWSCCVTNIEIYEK